MSDKDQGKTEAASRAKPASKKPAAKTTKAQATKASPKKTAATKKTSTRPKTAANATASKPAAKATPKKAAPKKTGATSRSAANSEPINEKQPQHSSAKEKTDEATGTANEQMSSEKQNAENDHKVNDAAKIVEELKGRNWPKIIQRALLMFFFGVLGTFALYLSFVLAVAQIGFTIFAGNPNEQLSRIIRQCGLYIKDVAEYLSFASDECPFPFGRDLPTSD